MRNLYFDKSYGPSVRAGIKTQTVRCWACRVVNAGETVGTNVGAVLKILEVRRIELSELTESDAARDGFASADLLRAKLAERYGDKPSPYYLISFENTKLLAAREWILTAPALEENNEYWQSHDPRESALDIIAQCEEFTGEAAGFGVDEVLTVLSEVPATLEWRAKCDQAAA